MENLSVISSNPSVVYIDIENIDEDRIDGEFYNYKCLENEIRLKKSGVKIKILNDIIERMNSPIGWQGIPSTSYLPHGLGVPLIRVQNISDLILDEESLIGVEENIYDEQPAIQAQANDIIITRVGTIGRVCRIPEKINRIAMGQNLTRVKLKETIIESGFMLAYMSSKFCQIQMKRYAYGGVQASLTNKNIKQLLVPIPSPEVQKFIGDKVRKAEELREEAKMLKKKAEEILVKEIGINSLNKGTVKYHWIKGYVVDDRVDSDFYDLKYQILIEIEKRFKCYLMEDIIIDKYTGKTPDKSCEDLEGIPLIVVKNIEENNINIDNIERWVKDDSNFRKTEENDLLITRVGSVGVTSIVEENEKGLFLSDNVICLKLKEGLLNRYIAFYLNSIYGKLMVERWTKGAVQGVINYQSINKFKIPIINKDIMKEIDLKLLKWKQLLARSKQLIQEAKQDVEDLIEDNFDMSKINVNNRN